MSIISSFFVLLLAIIIAIVSLWINEQYDYFDLNLPFEISDYISFSIDDVKSWFTTTKKRREIVETIDPTMLDEVAKDLKEDYIALRNEMVNYKDHNDYLVNERKMITLIEDLTKEYSIYEEELKKLDQLEQKDNFTVYEIKEIKHIIKEFNK